MPTGCSHPVPVMELICMANLCSWDLSCVLVILIKKAFFTVQLKQHPHHYLSQTCSA